jgi:hypothetical protein
MVVKVYEIIDRYFLYDGLSLTDRNKFHTLLKDCIDESYNEYHKKILEYYISKLLNYIKFIKIKKDNGNFSNTYKNTLQDIIHEFMARYGNTTDDKAKKLLFSTIIFIYNNTNDKIIKNNIITSYKSDMSSNMFTK